MKAERLVVDTNVLISAALIKASVPARLLDLALQHHRLMFSRATFEEFDTRLWRPKFDRYVSVDARKLLLHDLAGAADWVEPTDTSLHCRDPDDDKFIHAALAGSARYLISGDKDLLDLKLVGAVELITPARALTLLAKNSIGWAARR